MKLNSNLNFFWIYYSAMSLLNSDVKRGVFIIYILSIGINNTETGFLQTSLFIAMMMGELPSGFLADKYGRKLALICSFIFMILYGLGYLLFSTFTPFLIMFILNGLAFSLQSGSDQALLYDYLKANGSEKSFIKINSREKAISALAISASMALGGWLKDETSWQFLFLVFIFTKVVGLLLTCFLTEAKPSEISLDQRDDISLTEKNSVRPFFLSKKGLSLLPLFLGFAIYEAVLTPTYIYGQALLNTADFSLSAIGLAYAAIELTNAALYNFSDFISKKIKFTHLVIITWLILSASIFLLPVSGDFMIFMFYSTLCLPSFVDMIYMDYVNNHYPSLIRASCISVNSFLSSALISLSYVTYGFFIEKEGISLIFQCSSILVLAALPLALYGLFQLNSDGNQQKKPTLSQ